MIPGKAEALAEIALHRVPLVAIVAHWNAVFRGGELDRRAMLISGADRERLVAPRPAEPRIDVGRQHRANQIAEMLDAVDARDGAGDEDAFHEAATAAS